MSGRKTKINKKSLKSGLSRLKISYGFAAIPVVLLLIVVLLAMSVNSIYSMRRSIITRQQMGTAHALDKWAESVIGQLEIHRDNIENFFSEEEALKEYIASTYEQYEAYPYGIYLGDDTGFYLDASGWSGGDDYVVYERQWFIEGQDSRTFTFGEPYIDAMTGRICISVSALTNSNQGVRVMATDTYTDYPAAQVMELSEASGIAEALLVSGNGEVIIAGSGGETEGQKLSELSGARYTKLAGVLEETGADTEDMSYTASDASGIIQANIIHVDTADWYLAVFMKQSSLMAPVLKFIPFVLLIGAAAVCMLIWLAGKYVNSVTEMEEMATTDKLTGLLNRDGFKSVTARSGPAVAAGMLILLDLDNFKAINDNLGHPEGDKILVMFSALLKSFFNRSTDQCARLGGDEFAVVIAHDISAEGAENMLNRFMNMAEETFGDKYRRYGLSVSAGAAFWRPDRNYEALYKQADRLLYEAKNDGKGCYRVEQM